MGILWDTTEPTAHSTAAFESLQAVDRQPQRWLVRENGGYGTLISTLLGRGISKKPNGLKVPIIYSCGDFW